MEEKNISPEQSLQIIEKMLADTRNRFYNNGFAFLFWGAWIIIAVAADYYFDVYLQKHISGYLWLTSISVGVIFTFLYYMIIAPKNRAFSKLDSINSKIWIGYLGAFIVLMFLCGHYKIPAPPFIYCLCGLAMFASAGIYQFWSMYAGAAIFWIGAICWIVLGSEINLTLLSILIMFLGYLVPGYLLWRKAKKEVNV